MPKSVQESEGMVAIPRGVLDGCAHHRVLGVGQNLFCS